MTSSKWMMLYIDDFSSTIRSVLLICSSKLRVNLCFGNHPWILMDVDQMLTIFPPVKDSALGRVIACGTHRKFLFISTNVNVNLSNCVHEH